MVIYFYCHIATKIITCQKIKLSFLCDTKKLISFFLHHHFFIFSFYITHYQHVDLLHSGPRNNKTFNHLLFTCLIYTEVVTKEELLPKKGFLLSSFNVCKTSERNLFLSNFAKINTVRGIFQAFYLGFRQFSIVCNISRRLSKGRFRKF